MELLDHIAYWIEQTGHTILRERDSLLVESINLRIQCEVGGRTEHNVNGQKSVVLSVNICKMPDGTLHGDCWLNNHDWIEGLNALYWFGEEWPPTDAYTSLKQFIIVKPCEWDQLANPERA